MGAGTRRQAAQTQRLSAVADCARCAGPYSHTAPGKAEAKTVATPAAVPGRQITEYRYTGGAVRFDKLSTESHG